MRRPAGLPHSFCRNGMARPQAMQRAGLRRRSHGQSQVLLAATGRRRPRHSRAVVLPRPERFHARLLRPGTIPDRQHAPQVQRRRHPKDIQAQQRHAGESRRAVHAVAGCRQRPVSRSGVRGDHERAGGRQAGLLQWIQADHRLRLERVRTAVPEPRRGRRSVRRCGHHRLQPQELDLRSGPVHEVPKQRRGRVPAAVRARGTAQRKRAGVAARLAVDGQRRSRAMRHVPQRDVMLQRVHPARRRLAGCQALPS